jgi:hypothetical protein
MKGGRMEDQPQLRQCDCGGNAFLIWHYIKGVANTIHYFVQCEKCKNRTRDRKKPEGATSEWNVG